MSVQAERYIASFLILAVAFSAGAIVMWPWVKWERRLRQQQKEHQEIIYIEDRHGAVEELERMFKEHQDAKVAAQKAKDDAFFETVEEMHRDFNKPSQAS